MERAGIGATVVFFDTHQANAFVTGCDEPYCPPRENDDDNRWINGEHNDPTLIDIADWAHFNLKPEATGEDDSIKRDESSK